MNNGSQDNQDISQYIIVLITFMALLPLVWSILSQTLSGSPYPLQSG